MKLDLNDLRPQEAKFELSEKEGKSLTLKKISLAVNIWLTNRFGKDKIVKIFEDQSLAEISEIAYHLLKEKEEFPTLESFQEAIVTQKDRVQLMQAILTTVGLSQPVIEKLAEEGSQNPNA